MQGVAFSLIGEDDAACIEVVETFKYLRRILYQLDENLPAVIWNVRKAPQDLEPDGGSDTEGGGGATSFCHVLLGGGSGSPPF